MIPIKWKENENESWKYYTYVPKNLITRFIGEIRTNKLFEDDIFKFKITGDVVTKSSIIKNNIADVSVNPKHNFYYIEKKCLIEHNKEENSWIFISENFTEFKIGNDNWQPIKQIDFRYGGLCIFSFGHKLFVKLQDWLIADCDNKDFNNLEEKSLSKFTNYIQRK